MLTSVLLLIQFYQPHSVVMFSPYAFVVGGGEKYFLEVAAYFQKKGHKVTILTDISNFCHSKECVLDTAHQLDVTLESDFNYFRLDYSDGRKVRSCPVEYYYEMGKLKVSSVSEPWKVWHLSMPVPI